MTLPILGAAEGYTEEQAAEPGGLEWADWTR